MQIVELTANEVEHVAGGPFFLGFVAGFKAAKVGITVAAAAFGVGGAAAIAALDNEE